MNNSCPARTCTISCGHPRPGLCADSGCTSASGKLLEPSHLVLTAAVRNQATVETRDLARLPLQRQGQLLQQRLSEVYGRFGWGLADRRTQTRTTHTMGFRQEPGPGSGHGNGRVKSPRRIPQAIPAEVVQENIMWLIEDWQEPAVCCQRATAVRCADQEGWLAPGCSSSG
jgi:hypothetical protein